MPVFAACQFPLLSDSEAIDTVIAAVSTGEPFSLIRFGDGEAVVLSLDEEIQLQDLAYLHGHWGAEGVTLRVVADVRDDLQAALQGADVIGIRDDIVNVSLPDDLTGRSGTEVREFVVSEFQLRKAEIDNLSTSGARRLALLHRILSRMEWSEHQQFCSAWINWELLATGALSRILDGVAEVGLVTARPELEHLVARRFDVNARSVLVPDKFVEEAGSGHHVPNRYRTIRSEFDFPEGTLVLVGAGIPGKVYCQWLKETGCVAIDVGSVLDAWVGKASRPLILKSRFRIETGDRVPADLQLDQSAWLRNRRVIPRWKATGVPD